MQNAFPDWFVYMMMESPKNFIKACMHEQINDLNVNVQEFKNSEAI